MDFNISETVTQKTKELVEKVLVEHWYNTAGSIAKQVREQYSGRSKETSDLRAQLCKLVLSLHLAEKDKILSEILSKLTSFEALIRIFNVLTEHLHKEGVLKYESEKGYHSVIGDEMDTEQEI